MSKSNTERPLLHRHDQAPLPGDHGSAILGRLLAGVVFLVLAGAVYAAMPGLAGSGFAFLLALAGFLSLAGARSRAAVQAEEHQLHRRNRWFDFSRRHPILAYLAVVGVAVILLVPLILLLDSW